MGFNVAIRLLLLLGAIQVIAALPTWTPIAKTGIVFMKLTHPGVTQSYSIPNAVPNSAKAVLIYASVQCGRTSPEVSQDITIFI